jgi:photosystem I subunit 11
VFRRKGGGARARAEAKNQVVKPMNGDPFIGMLETPVTSAPIVAKYLSNLPAYRTGVSVVTRGVEIGLVHGFFLPGPFIRLGPLRELPQADALGCTAAAGLVVILTACLTIYGLATYQSDRLEPKVGVKTLSGRSIEKDPLYSADGWAGFTSGFAVGGLSGVLWCYILTQTLPFYYLTP